MVTRPFQMQDLKGLSPAIEPTQSDEVFALSGRNYAFDTRGPYTPFGNRLLTPVPRLASAHIQGVRLKLGNRDRTFMFDGHGIWEWDEQRRGFRCIYLTPEIGATAYRWTWAYLDAKVYFAHPAVGCIVYFVDSDRAFRHQEVANVEIEEIIAVNENNGRIVFTTPTQSVWSAPGNGLDLVPELGGAGFQIIAERVSGDPIIATPYAGGYLTWTTGGVMRSEFTADAAVYRHRQMDTEYRPANSFCTAQMDAETRIILDERGLFQTQGGAPTPFAPLFNEFLLRYCQDNNLVVGQNMRLEWDELRRFLFVCLSTTYASAVYERAFVLYPPLDKWGSFDQPFNGILPLKVNYGERADDYYGFADADGLIRFWDNRYGSTEVIGASAKTANLDRPFMARPARANIIDSETILSAGKRADTTRANARTGVAGYYQNAVANPVIPTTAGLNAVLRFGLFRPNPEMSFDEMTEITNVTIRSVQSGDQVQLSSDFDLVVSDDVLDYSDPINSEDYGEGIANYVNHGFRIISTLDGRTVYNVETPSLVGFTKGARYFSCGAVGVWHIFEVTAENPGEAFHLLTVGFTAIPAGRVL